MNIVANGMVLISLGCTHHERRRTQFSHTFWAVRQYHDLLYTLPQEKNHFSKSTACTGKVDKHSNSSVSVSPSLISVALFQIYIKLQIGTFSFPYEIYPGALSLAQRTHISCFLLWFLFVSIEICCYYLLKMVL